MEFQDKMGRWFTEGMFVEVSRTDKIDAPYCLNPRNETKDMPSLKRLYLECADPTEYLFATTHLGGWKHWQKLLRCSWFKPHIKEWREELEIKLRAEGIREQRRLANKGSSNAARWLAEKGWEEKKRGRPSKAEVAGERKREAEIEKELEEHFDRVFN